MGLIPLRNGRRVLPQKGALALRQQHPLGKEVAVWKIKLPLPNQSILSKNTRRAGKAAFHAQFQVSFWSS